VTWYASTISDTRHGIFATFETDEARQTHLDGQTLASSGQVADDPVAASPIIRTVDIIAVR
jgi:hypothetical protein